jgi:UDP-3-O-acyl-N-acetylglucosamine deacetylase
MPDAPYGLVLAGMIEDVARSYERFARQPVDWDLSAEPPDPPESSQTTLARSVAVTGPGTYFGRAQRRLAFEPSSEPGWWFDRADHPENLPIRVSVRNVWNTTRNIVLRCGPPNNYMRMVEHIIALRLGLGLDNVLVRVDSGDPPLFDRGSMDLVEALESAGTVRLERPAALVTVKETVTVGGPHGSFLTVLPAGDGPPALHLDCALDFPNAIGRQRLRVTVNRAWFRYGALARTNTTAGMKFYCQTVGKLFADIRNLGYTDANILIAGRRRYLNEPHLMHDGKSLEPAWHRAMLDLLAALALIDHGRFVGRVWSYKAGHALDVKMVQTLYRHDLFRPLRPPAQP